MLSYRGYFTSQMNLRKLEKLVSLVAEIIAAIFIKHARPGKSATDREKQRERERERERDDSVDSRRQPTFALSIFFFSTFALRRSCTVGACNVELHSQTETCSTSGLIVSGLTSFCPRMTQDDEISRWGGRKKHSREAVTFLIKLDIMRDYVFAQYVYLDLSRSTCAH